VLHASKTAQEFVFKMDAGAFDGTFFSELKNLPSALLEEIVTILVERIAPSTDPRKPH
jgi:hypothetical protein